MIFIGDLKPYCLQLDTSRAMQYKRLLEQADRYKQMELPLEHPKESTTYMGIAIANLALAYRLSGSEQYLQDAKRFMNTVLSYEKWGNAHLVNVDLSASWILFGLSLGYDWLKPYLSEEEKQRIFCKIRHHARTNMPDYDHETYTALPENNTSSSENSPEMLEPIDKGEALPEYANLPDTTSSDIGLKKGTSAWDGSHTIEWFDVENVSLKETLTALQINHPIAPSWLPDGYKQIRIKVTNDHMIGAYDVRADYAKDVDDSKLFIQISQITDITGDTIEKDDRAVIEYTKEKTTWYIMHNLQRLNAAALMDDYQVLISAPISVDEMKKIIDSIY